MPPSGTSTTSCLLSPGPMSSTAPRIPSSRPLRANPVTFEPPLETVNLMVPAGAWTTLTTHDVSAARTVIGPAGTAATEVRPPPEGPVPPQPATATATPAVTSAATDLRAMALLRGVGAVKDACGHGDQEGPS